MNLGGLKVLITIIYTRYTWRITSINYSISFLLFINLIKNSQIISYWYNFKQLNGIQIMLITIKKYMMKAVNRQKNYSQKINMTILISMEKYIFHLSRLEDNHITVKILHLCTLLLWKIAEMVRKLKLSFEYFFIKIYNLLIKFF